MVTHSSRGRCTEGEQTCPCPFAPRVHTVPLLGGSTCGGSLGKPRTFPLTASNACVLCAARAGERFFGLPTSTASAAIAELAAVRGIKVHGSASAVDWDANSRLALFHTKDTRGQYATVAYLMARTPPYSILNVSRPLPLAGGVHAFASSLSWAPGGQGPRRNPTNVVE